MATLVPIYHFKQRQLALLVSLAFYAGSLWADTAATSINIPAQSLDTALQQLAQQNGVQILFVSDLVKGLQSSKLQGQLTLEQASERLLQQTHLQLKPLGEGRYSIVKISSDDSRPVTIMPKLVSGAKGESATSLPLISLQAQQAGTTDGTQSYTTRSMSTATKMNLSMRETPQAVTVITNQRIQDQNLATVNDVVQATPGLTFRRFGPERASFYARGMYVDNLMFDGLPVSLDSSNLSQDLLATDMAIYDRVEIVRGATGLVQGAGNPSAAINLVRKRPTDVPQISVDLSAGSWDRYRAELDASGPLSKDGSLRGRTVIAAQDYESYKRGESSNGQTFYGILEKDLNASTTLTLSALHQESRLHGNGFTGLPVARDGSDLGLPRSTSYANDWEHWNKTTSSAFVGLNHLFDNNWRMHLSAYYAQADVDMLGHYLSYSFTTGNYTQLGARNSHQEKQSSVDLYANGPFELLGRTHELVLGASYRNIDFDGNSRQGVVLNSNLNLYNFDSSAVANPNIPLRDWMDAKISQQSVYATTRLNLADRLKLILGGRLDWFDYNDTVNTYPNFASNTPSVSAHNNYSVSHQLTKYAGLVYDLNDQHSIYVSYTDIFKPQNYLDASSKLLDPVTGNNYEMGIKGEYFDGALNASAAVFRMDQENRAFRSTDQTQCAGYPTVTCYSAAGEVRSEGAEFEVQGAVTPNWQVGAGYTVAIARYRKDATAANVGAVFDTDTPRHLFKLSTMYRLPGELQHWRVGGSVYRQGSIYNKGTASGVPFYISQSAYTVADLILGWQATPKLDLRLNINNVFDKKYYNALSGTVGFPSNVYGEPRNVTLSAKYNF
ncbi:MULTISPECIES: TonB-dependent siderophore receptor [unclassified Acinetobacter]|uniref:TonB-dependent siderophore receptor n=1 Tax=unclassified Acinetobacter TaxID=196816 RepID=UPI00190C1C04|nr:MULTISPECIES: TonB-dependent receptor [unclassified Acinetobacter]MBK0065019.1 TonB-dependent siderophore receptor [Acinetobacter sp. S55]MBK0065321.1 TonB-dependent siderophore receptor [Acinetobacter sp. S54]